MPPDRYMIDAWGEDPDSWNLEGNGEPGIGLVGNAIQVWAVFNGVDSPPSSVAAAARAFNIDPCRLIEAVEAHAWMFLTGPADDLERLMIEHDGE